MNTSMSSDTHILLLLPTARALSSVSVSPALYTLLMMLFAAVGTVPPVVVKH